MVRSHKEKHRDVSFYFSSKEYLVVFAAVLIFNSLHSIVLNGYFHKYGYGYNSVYFILSVLTNLIIISVASYFVLILMRLYFFERPMRVIGRALHRIAKGDFSVRVELPQTNRQNDEMTFLIEHFNKMAQELASIETLKTDFVSNVSHEFKSPLSEIQNYAYALQDECLTPEERQEYAGTIIQASQKLSILVTNILKLNRLENQNIFPMSKSFALGEQIRSCVLAFDTQLDEKRIEVISEEIEDFFICQDESLLELIWNNLISNAIKFTPLGGCLIISLRKKKGKAVCTIEDTGCGMDKQALVHIFEKFYQVETSHSQEGNGLGLAMVKRAVDIVGGSISVDSTPGKGTLFSIVIPLKSADI